jgi:hypothetical protein
MVLRVEYGSQIPVTPLRAFIILVCMSLQYMTLHV